MSKLIYAGGTGSANSMSNCQKFLVRYFPATQVTMYAGESLDLATVMPVSEKIDIQFQSTDSKGTIQIATSMPLLLLAHIQGLEASNIIYAKTETLDAEGGSPPKVKVVYLEFVIPIFEVCRQFQAAEQLQVSVKLTSGATVEISNIDSPYQQPTSKAFQYRIYTIQPGNTQGITPAAGKIYVANDDNFTLQLYGTTMVQWKKNDFYANFADDLVSNFTPLQKANYLGVDLKGFRNSQLVAGEGNLDYFYIQKNTI